MLKDATNIVDLVFQAIKHDILSVLRPTSMVLESITILLPEAISVFETTLKRFEKMYRKFIKVAPDVLKDHRLFSTFSDSRLPLIAFNNDGVVLGCTNKAQPQLEDGVVTFSGFNIRNRALEHSIASVYSAMKDNLEIMRTALSNCMSFLSEDVLFSSVSTVVFFGFLQRRFLSEDVLFLQLDSKSYQFKDRSDILDAANIVVSHFMDVLLENNFVEQRLGEKSVDSLVWIVCNFYRS